MVETKSSHSRISGKERFCDSMKHGCRKVSYLTEKMNCGEPLKATESSWLQSHCHQEGVYARTKLGSSP